MENRQLDLNAPLLSVRRFTSPSNSQELGRRNIARRQPPIRQQSLPVAKSQYGYEAEKPIAVPFHWEQIPGRPKDEVPTPEEPDGTPRLPPARLSDAIRYNSGEITKLPPGRVMSSSRYNSGERSNDNVYRPQVEALSFNDHANLLEKLNDSLKYDDDSGSESGDDTYSDALDVLSMDYSVSGLSGYHNSGLESSGKFSVDKQTREFMMNRFLPAAKAVVIETPQHIVKKPPVVTEQPNPVKKVISGERKAALRQYQPASSPYHSKYRDNVESEVGGELPPIRVKKSGKTWGILPKICAKSSLFLMNPLPALKSKATTPSRCPTPSIGDMRRLTRNAHSGPLDKKACPPVPQKKKFHSGLLLRDLPDIENKLSNNSYEFLNQHDYYNSGGSSLLRNRSGNISPYRNESPRSPFREGTGFLGVPKEVENRNANKIASSRRLFKALHDVSRNQINERGLEPVEKTVYVDSVQKISLPLPKSPVKRTDSFEHIGLSGDRLKFLEGIRQKGDARLAQYALETKMFEEEKIPNFKFKSTDITGAKLHKSSDLETLGFTRVLPDVTFVMDSEMSEDDKRDSIDHLLKSPLPPPLPKSPSESWLWRTLGSPFSNSSSKSPLHPRKKGQKGPKANTKWETIVKTSNLRHDHIRCSEELVPYVSRRQNRKG